MAATPTYAFPYPTVDDSPHGPNQIRELAEAVEGKFIGVDADRVLIKQLLSGYSPPTQTGSGSLSAGGDGATIMSVAIPDPGFAYHIIASGSMGWAMTAGSQGGQLLEVAITINSTVYNVNRLVGASGVSISLGAGFNQNTIRTGERRSDSFGAQAGGKTVRLIARNTGSSTMTIPANSPEITLSVRIVPA